MGEPDCGMNPNADPGNDSPGPTRPVSISTRDPNWQAECARMQSEGLSLRLVGVRTMEHIKFAEAFAAKHRMLLNFDNGTFIFTPYEN